MLWLTGHPQAPTIRIKDNEEGHLSKYCGHNSFVGAWGMQPLGTLHLETF